MINRRPLVWVPRPTFDDEIARLRPYFKVRAEPEDLKFTPTELAAKLADCDATLAGGNLRIGAQEIEHAKQLRSVANRAAGCDNLDLSARGDLQPRPWISTRVSPRLLALENVVLSPHIASATANTRCAMSTIALDSLLAWFGYGPNAGHPLNRLNPELLAACAQRSRPASPATDTIEYQGD